LWKRRTSEIGEESWGSKKRNASDTLDEVAAWLSTRSPQKKERKETMTVIHSKATRKGNTSYKKNKGEDGQTSVGRKACWWEETHLTKQKPCSGEITKTMRNYRRRKQTDVIRAKCYRKWLWVRPNHDCFDYLRIWIPSLKTTSLSLLVLAAPFSF
jgi:3',5'-cyclic AMP phosphodiesterase CpdA